MQQNVRYVPGVLNMVHGARDAVEFICKDDTIKVRVSVVGLQHLRMRRLWCSHNARPSA